MSQTNVQLQAEVHRLFLCLQLHQQSDSWDYINIYICRYAQQVLWHCLVATLSYSIYWRHLYIRNWQTLTVVSCNLFLTTTAVSTQSMRAHWRNSHFIHCTKIEVGDGIRGCIRTRHWASGVGGPAPSPVLHRVTSDHLTSSKCWSAPSDSDLACFIQCQHWYTSISGMRDVWACNRVNDQSARMQWLWVWCTNVFSLSCSLYSIKLITSYHWMYPCYVEYWLCMNIVMATYE